MDNNNNIIDRICKYRRGVWELFRATVVRSG